MAEAHESNLVFPLQRVISPDSLEGYLFRNQRYFEDLDNEREDIKRKNELQRVRNVGEYDQGLALEIAKDYVVSAKERDLARKDPLLSLWNKGAYDEFLDNEVKSKHREGNSDFSLILPDIDHFKFINDTYGHPFGDEALKKFKDEVKRCIRGTDKFCRLGGEEFGIILPTANINQGMKVAEKIRKSLDENLQIYQNINTGEPIILRPTEYENLTDKSDYDLVRSLHSSFGVGSYGLDRDVSAKGLHKLVDQALYHAKENGRNRVSSVLDL